MDEKSAREDFRVRQYSGAQAGPSTCDSLSYRELESDFAIGTSRCIIHFDVDAFYAQVEEGRDPKLRHVPMAVTQKYLIVTANYPARSLGVTKLQAIAAAVERCPNLVLINGEDLSPYRRASKQILAALQRFGVAERLGMDEVFLDVTAEVRSRMDRGLLSSSYTGHIVSSKVSLRQETKHRPMDLRAEKSKVLQSMDVQPVTEVAEAGPHSGCSYDWEVALRIASNIAAEARAAVKAETGYRASAGISCSKMLAKLVSGIHKPDDQSILLPCHAAEFVAPLPVRAIPGVGYRAEAELTVMDVTTVNDLRAVPRAKLVKVFGDRMGSYFYCTSRGEDPTPVVQSGPAKSITVEDSFKSCTTFTAAVHVLQILVPDLLSRLQEDFEENQRRPKVMTLKWRQKKQGWSRSSASVPMPVQPFSLTLLNVGATSFGSASSGSQRELLSRYFGGIPKSGPPLSAPAGTCDAEVTAAAAVKKRRDYGANPQGCPMSKRKERMLSESSRALVSITPQQQQELGSFDLHQFADHHQAFSVKTESHDLLADAEQLSHDVEGPPGLHAFMPVMAASAGSAPEEHTSNAVHSTHEAGRGTSVQSASYPLPNTDSKSGCDSGHCTRLGSECEPSLHDHDVTAEQHAAECRDSTAAADPNVRPQTDSQGCQAPAQAAEINVPAISSTLSRCAPLHVSGDELRRLEQLCGHGASTAAASGLLDSQKLSEQERSDLQIALRLQEEEFKLHRLRRQPVAAVAAPKRKVAGKLNTLDAFVKRNPKL